MDSEGYPTEDELDQIKNWFAHDFRSLIDFIESRWAYPDYIKREVVKDRFQGHILQWTLCTAGWSGNESIINALLQNQLFCMIWYYSWQRGGKYVFKIDPKQVGFKTIQEFCREYPCTRQYIHKTKDKWEFFYLSKNKGFIRVKNYDPNAKKIWEKAQEINL